MPFEEKEHLLIEQKRLTMKMIISHVIFPKNIKLIFETLVERLFHSRKFINNYLDSILSLSELSDEQIKKESDESIKKALHL